MRICQVSKADAFGGGASRVAGELCELLLEEGYSSQHWVSWTGKGYDDHRRPLYGSLERYIRKAHNSTKALLSLPEAIPYELPIFYRNGRIDQFDLFHFHDLSSAISSLTLQTISQKRPVVWTMHDCSPVTGGCLYPMECERYKIGCGSCPQIGEWPIDTRFDFTYFLRGLKARLHATERVTMVTPSQWMADFAMSSGLLHEKPVVIPNGVDTDRFHPVDRTAIRLKHAIPDDRPIVLLTAGHIKDPRKGVQHALNAMRHFDEEVRPRLMLVGVIDDDARKMLEGFAIFETGYISNPDKLAEIYAASDLLLFCSLAENMPLTILEAMACGVPFVGFGVGGIPEMIVQNETGIAVPALDIAALAEALNTALVPSILARWSLAARQRAETVYSHRKFITAHVQLYERLIEARLREKTGQIKYA
ncbi:glycosyltransferase involved in cell wall biosynthesis [Rhizobium sp. ERR 1071]|uniref:glycosyltransferase n=1 Tax=Rhizobium sp. ERR 1071 TaxID=2572677 RepID=UPI0011994E00|nr:glycosyltransferase [Rhizobium sp. ERR1071]TWB11694.1 glycosyltransferase involved in cell wall biosynthesis [Rhizobium sp. ERR1071]